jgi:hypothetical protein
MQPLVLLGAKCQLTFAYALSSRQVNAAVGAAHHIFCFIRERTFRALPCKCPGIATHDEIHSRKHDDNQQNLGHDASLAFNPDRPFGTTDAALRGKDYPMPT